MNYIFWLQIISGLGLFVYAILKFSQSIKRVVGGKMKNYLEIGTKTPIRGTILGTLFTAIIQSSTATTVLTVGLVQAGLMTFTNSLGVIFGANIGTTITTQLVAFRFSELAIYIIGIAAAGYIFGNQKWRNISKIIFYFGLIFFAIKLISGSIESIKDEQVFADILSLAFDPISSIIFGFFLTVLAQSSSVVSSMVVILVGQGVLDFSQAIGIIIGANVGTTVTSLFVSAAMNVAAKRAALAHFLFNFFGAIFFLPFWSLVVSFQQFLGDDIVHQVANFHLLFNVVCTIIFLIIIEPFARVIIDLVPYRIQNIK